MDAGPPRVLDPSQAATYPVVLSDALLGQPAKEVFTGVRYNHKPGLSSETAPDMARLKPAIPGMTASYDLSFADDDGGKYAYVGARTVEDNKYVLYFDANRKVFVLDRVDSTFNMNLTRTPDNTDPESLSRQFQQLDTSTGSSNSPPTGPSTSTTSKTTAKAAIKEPVRRKQPEKKKKTAKSVELVLPTPKPEPKKKPVAAPKRRPQTPEDDEDSDDEDDDGGLTIEYPGSDPNGPSDFSPAFPAKFHTRRFSDFIRESDVENDSARDGDDADESEEQDDDDEDKLAKFQLPSPVNKKAVSGGTAKAANPPDVADLEADLEAHLEADLEGDLEAELENELRQASGGSDSRPAAIDADSESEMSEED